MTLHAMALPIRPGKIEQWKQFAADINGPHRAAWLEQLRSAGISAEHVFHQQTPAGDLAVIVWQGEDLNGVMERISTPANDFAATRLPALLAEVHGADPATPPASPTLVSAIASEGTPLSGEGS